jgi:tetratricopeptide (TPR) repeat protein
MPRGTVGLASLKIVTGIFGGIVLLICVLWFRQQSVITPIPETGAGDLVEKPVAINPGYLGVAACVDCHADRVAEFRQTRHFLANRVPGPDIMPDGFKSGHPSYRLPESSLQFEMSESLGRFQQTALQSQGSTKRSTTADIAFIYGSAGGNDEVYFTWHGDRLCELPMVWLAPEKTWGTSPFDRHASGDFSRDVTIRCIECHNTWFEHVPGSRNQYGRDKNILGVTCEVCHGPSREHVDFHRANPRLTDSHAIVRPAELSRERKMDLCAQCHSNAIKHRGPAFNYRPGQPLDDFYFTLRTKHPEDDHVANQTTYLRQSKCYQNSETLTCVSCHNPHQPHSQSNAGATSCYTCHQKEACTDRHQLPVAIQDDCIGCHMPERRKIQVYFRTETDQYVAPVKRYEHKIAIYPLARQKVLLNWYRAQTDPESRAIAERLAHELGSSWSAESVRLQAEYRYLAAIDACRESLGSVSEPVTAARLQELIAIKSKIDADFQDAQWHITEKRYREAIESLQSVLDAKPNYAMAHAKLGTVYAITGEMALAKKHLEQAIQDDEDEPYAFAMLGWLAYLDGRFDEALQHYRRAEEVEPYSGKINHRMGLAYLKLKRWSEAADRFKAAIKIDPQDVSSCVSLSDVLGQMEKWSDAVVYARQAVTLTNSAEPNLLKNLAAAYSKNGQLDEAIKAAEQALKVAQSTQPALVPHLQIMLDQLRSVRKR